MRPDGRVTHLDGKARRNLPGRWSAVDGRTVSRRLQRLFVAHDARVLVLGGFLVAAVALVAGTSGFGFGLLATPLLLLSGFSLPFVVTLNLLMTVAARVSVVARLRRSIDPRRAALLVGGSIPGLYVGARIIDAVDAHDLRIVAGVAVMAAAAAILYADRHPPRVPGPAAPVTAGFLGGLLGTSTSLLGVPPALLLARQRLAAASFIADLAVYFIVSGTLGLAMLAAAGELETDAGSAFLYWLPGVLLANALGTTIGLRVPQRSFRLGTLTLAFAAGALTAATA
jgi:uncharacterized protein